MAETTVPSKAKAAPSKKSIVARGHGCSYFDYTEVEEEANMK